MGNGWSLQVPRARKHPAWVWRRPSKRPEARSRWRSWRPRLGRGFGVNGLASPKGADPLQLRTVVLPPATLRVLAGSLARSVCGRRGEGLKRVRQTPSVRRGRSRPSSGTRCGPSFPDIPDIFPEDGNRRTGAMRPMLPPTHRHRRRTRHGQTRSACRSRRSSRVEDADRSRSLPHQFQNICSKYP